MNAKLIAVLGMVCLAWLGGCEGSGPPAGQWQLDGTVEGYRGQVVLDRVAPKALTPVDSAIIGEDGSFTFTRPADEAIFYELRFPANGAHFPFDPHADLLQFQWQPNTPRSWTFTGNAASEILRHFITERGTQFKAYVNAKKRLQLIPKNTTLQRWRDQEAVVDQSLLAYRSYLRHFIDTVSVPELKTYAMYSMNIDGNFHYIQRELEQLPPNDRSQDFAAAMREELDRIEQPFRSTEPVDIEGVNPQGDTVRLKEGKGKMTLLYFWASYCEYSRQENEVLKKLYSEYADKGFTIYSVSIDDFEGDWQRAAADLPWPGNIWQSGAWNAEALMGYDVPSIPTTYLLDYRAGLRSKNIRAAELEAHMDELLTQWGPPPSTKDL